MSIPERSRQLHQAMLAERARDIDAVRRRLNDPMLCIPRMVWLVAALTGTSAQIHCYLMQRLQRRRARLLREAHTLIELLRWQDETRRADPH